MADYHIQNIQEVLKQKLHPTLVVWNRLEGRPRAHNFERALKAEVRDALWMITKQWQMGEYQGDDAGSPVFAKVHISSSRLTGYKASNHPDQEFERNVPLEVKAEQKKIPFERGGFKASIDIRLQMGKYWLKLLQSKSLNYDTVFIEKFPFELPENDRQTDVVFAHQEVWKTMAAVSGRCLDGYALYEYLLTNDAAKDITDTDPDKTALNELGILFKEWYRKQYYQPEDEVNNAWLADRMEYQFQCDASSDKEDKVLKASEYAHGHLDWFAFDLEKKHPKGGGAVRDKFTSTFIPKLVQFDGMPDTRWWKFEDGKTSFGDIKPSTTDLSKLLLMEFGLVYANDWFVIPYKLPVGSLANVEGLSVKNNFGETLWIKATEEEGNTSSVWSMYKMRSDKQDNTLFLAPAAVKVHEGKALEEIALIRDEVANMVWGIEKTVPLITGVGDRGGEAGLRIRQFHETKVNGSKIPNVEPFKAPIYYQAMTEVPENWIPFVPVHVKNDNREIQLQRASMVRIIEGDTLAPSKIKPYTSILREGLDENNPQAFFIHEEEVPRAGIQVSQAFQRTRWMNGEVYVWLGMRKQIGRGEGSSGLAFDQIRDGKNE